MAILFFVLGLCIVLLGGVALFGSIASGSPVVVSELLIILIGSVFLVGGGIIEAIYRSAKTTAVQKGATTPGRSKVVSGAAEAFLKHPGKGQSEGS